MKATTRVLIVFIISAILLIVFVTIAALIPALRETYNNLAYIDTPICIIAFVIWISDIFGE